MRTRVTVGWILYDVGNSAFVLVINSLAYSVYFRDFVFQGGPGADLAWGVVVSLSLILSGLIGPFIGAAADRPLQRLRVFRLTAGSAIVLTFTLALVRPGDRLAGIGFFLVGNAVYNISIAIYDSYLAIIADVKRRNLISGLGWGFGYLGGIACLAVAYPFLREANQNADAFGYRMSFVITAIFFLVFSLPSLLWLPRGQAGEGYHWKPVWSQVLNTIKGWRAHREFAKLLLAFYFVIDAITTLVYFTSIYATTSLKLSITEIMGLLLGTQLIAVPATIVFSSLANRLGLKTVFIGSLGVWMINVGFLASATTKGMLATVMILTGLVIGTTQAVGRSWLAALAEKTAVSELFGFSAIATRVSSVLGPIMFGAVAYLTGNQRWAVWSLLLFLVIGSVLAINVRSSFDLAGPRTKS
jgi:MFS transporter, UMF1 family